MNGKSDVVFHFQLDSKLLDELDEKKFEATMNFLTDAVRKAVECVPSFKNTVKLVCTRIQESN